MVRWKSPTLFLPTALHGQYTPQDTGLYLHIELQLAGYLKHTQWSELF